MPSRPRSIPFPGLAFAGVFLPVLLLGGSLVLGAVRPGYDPLRDALSELGEQGATNALLWDIGGFGGSALLYALYSVAIRAGFGGGWLFRLVVLQAIATAGSGLFSCDAGCPPVAVSTSGWLHTVSGLTYFAVTALLPFVAWRSFRSRTEWRSLASVSLGMGVLLTVLFFIGPALGADRVGLWQRTFLVPAFAWQIALALRLHSVLTVARSGHSAGPLRAETIASAATVDSGARGGDLGT
jgi:hypothetical membrane protein